MEFRIRTAIFWLLLMKYKQLMIYVPVEELQYSVAAEVPSIYQSTWMCSRLWWKTDFLYSVQYVVTPSWLEIFSWQLETPFHRPFWENVWKWQNKIIFDSILSWFFFSSDLQATHPKCKMKFPVCLVSIS